MKHPMIVFIAAFISLTLAPVVVDMAFAQEKPPEPQFERPQCIPAEQIFVELAKLGEVPVFVGTANGLTGLYTRNSQTTSWTFVLVGPNGCVVIPPIGGNKSADLQKKPGSAL